MLDRRPSANSATPAAAGSVYDSITLHAFIFTLTVVTAVVLSYGPAAALHHVVDVLAAAGTPSVDPAAWQGAMAF